MKLLITAILLSAALMEPAAAGANTVGKVAESNAVDTAEVSTYAACPRLKVRPRAAPLTPVVPDRGGTGKAMHSAGV